MAHYLVHNAQIIKLVKAFMEIIRSVIMDHVVQPHLLYPVNVQMAATFWLVLVTVMICVNTILGPMQFVIMATVALV
uniref:Uncharacterized protein n=1 Tax=Panagrolaimus superbus TaxID=310955 RepID=A0A914YY07_9BILA